jgi:hypothetical protein
MSELLPSIALTPKEPSSNNGNLNKKGKEDDPLYGTREYWEQRYSEAPADRKTSTAEVKQDDDRPLASHAWYFTYDELRPLIMPLLLGAEYSPPEEEEEEDPHNSHEDDDSLTNSRPPKNETSSTEVDTATGSRDVGQEGGNDLDSNRDDEDRGNEDGGDSEVDNNNEEDRESGDGGDIVDGMKGDDQEEDSEEEDDSVDEEEEEEEEPIERIGLARNGPITILEIGCGDVPLGTGIAFDLLDLENKTGSPALNLVQKILCVDYSPTVVKLMQHQYRRTVSAGSRAEQPPDQKKSRIELVPPGCVDVKHIPLEFAVVDARKMPYENETVALILDKGTLDAMLSDKKDGEKNCIQTLSEYARVLVEGGAIMIVSHLNAHTPSGISWLEDVVFTGLRSGSGKDTAWTIEVHGNGDTPEEDEDEVSAVLEQSVGPAVYIIHKKRQCIDKVSENPTAAGTIPVTFCSY